MNKTFQCGLTVSTIYFRTFKMINDNLVYKKESITVFGNIKNSSVANKIIYDVLNDVNYALSDIKEKHYNGYICL